MIPVPSVSVYPQLALSACLQRISGYPFRRRVRVIRRQLTDEGGGTGVVLTEEIVVRILESHFFIADLTFENAGVLLEAGVAMGLKSNLQIVLITQGNLSDLHFDIRNNHVITYNHSGFVEQLANALIAAGAGVRIRSQGLY